jgi:hypothetical protein
VGRREELLEVLCSNDVFDSFALKHFNPLSCVHGDELPLDGNGTAAEEDNAHHVIPPTHTTKLN